MCSASPRAPLPGERRLSPTWQAAGLRAAGAE